MDNLVGESSRATAGSSVDPAALRCPSGNRCDLAVLEASESRRVGDQKPGANHRQTTHAGELCDQGGSVLRSGDRRTCDGRHDTCLRHVADSAAVGNVESAGSIQGEMAEGVSELSSVAGAVREPVGTARPVL